MAEELTYLIVKSYEGEYLTPAVITPIGSTDLLSQNQPNNGPNPAPAAEPTEQPTQPPIDSDQQHAPSTQEELHEPSAPLPPRNSTASQKQEPSLYHGAGHATFNSGHTYTGNFANGFMEGKGVFVWRDGVKYEGDFKDNKISGSGEYTWKNGSKYIGDVKDGLRSGVGRFACGGCLKGQVAYEGEWEAGKTNGSGKLVYNKEGTSFYEGTWLNGLKHGKGTMHYVSGNVYSGEWSKNVKEGKGKMVWSDRGEEYEGHWENGMPHGFGVYTWNGNHSKNHQLPMQNTYEGEWVCGKRTGYGVFEYASGARYEGQWRDNLKHGQGSCIYENGRVFTGEFRNDRPVIEAPKFQNDYPFIFNLKGLPVNQSDPTLVEETMRAINNVILRHTNDLRKVYSYYCNLGMGKEAENEAPNHAITRIQLWKFFDDCKLKQKGHSFVDLDRTCIAHFKDDPLFKKLYNDPHNVSQHFIFRDFLDVILRISHRIYSTHTGDLSIHEHGVAAAFSHFIKADIIPNSREESKEVEEDAIVFEKALFVEMEQQFSDGVYKLYSTLATKNFRKTVTIRILLHFLNDARIIDADSGPLSISKFLSVFDSQIPGVIGDLGSYNLEFELVPYEMFVSFYDCLKQKTLGLLHQKAYEAASLKAAEFAVVAAALEAERLALEMQSQALLADEAVKDAEAAAAAAMDLVSKEAEKAEAVETPVGKKDKGGKAHKDAPPIKGGKDASKDVKDVKEVAATVPKEQGGQQGKLAAPLGVEFTKEREIRSGSFALDAGKVLEIFGVEEELKPEPKNAMPKIEEFIDPGQEGDLMTEIRDTTGIHYMLHMTDEDDYDRVLELSGPLDLRNTNMSRSLTHDKPATLRILFAQELVPNFIGASGKKINWIRHKANVEINVRTSGVLLDSTETVLSLTGAMDSIHIAGVPSSWWDL
ncbi:UNVERIFIED_CONTAM: hypothetical protein HDU68_000765 [Siphonaria sp. JEL0065]|nr:hypothetical protein HDU68_000765 [Siphonaria sp. JEL0065]